VKDVIAGMVGGIAATVPMTVAMEIMHAMLPATERRPLPPRRIEERLTRAVGARRSLREPEHLALTMLLHLGFGGAAGAVYGVASPRLPGPPLAKGAGFGVAVWALSYFGGLPATGVERSARREPPGRNALMVLAHVVWGGVLGEVAHRLRTDESTRATRRVAREKALASVGRSRRRVLALVRRSRA
jgi:uncharacterized membrane protein YagU involved in acid resistance